ncbi:MAG: hypothetical protein ACLVKS_06360, partial [Peptococcus niger]
MRSFNEQLQHLFGDAHLAKSLGIETERLQRIAEDAQWTSEAAGLLDQTPIPAKAVVQLAGDFLTAADLALPEDWPQTVYDIASGALFNNRGEGMYSERLRAAAFFSLDLLGLFLSTHRRLNGLDKRLDFM